MRISEFIRKYYEHNPEGHFFDKDTMKFFGDTRSNYAVTEHETMWELRRKLPVRAGLQNSAWFSKDTFQHLTNVKDV